MAIDDEPRKGHLPISKSSNSFIKACENDVIVFLHRTIQPYSAWPDAMALECSDKVVLKNAVIPIKYKNTD